jgi:dUTP pyrophosphatase
MNYNHLKTSDINKFDIDFSLIDTKEKTYILGFLLANYSKLIKDNHLIFNSLNFDIINNIKNLFNTKIIINTIYTDHYNVDIFKYYFKIKSNDIVNKINEYLFNKNVLNMIDILENDLKIYFLKGIFDNIGNINEKLFECTIDYDINNVSIIEKLCNFIDIPYLSCNDKNAIKYNDVNVIDFLGKIYKQGDVLKNDILYNKYISMLLYNDKSLPSCKIFKNDTNAVIPSKVRESDAGYDLTIIKKVKDLNETTVLYDTGISIVLPPCYYAEIVPRSSLSKSGYMLANSIGIIDTGYRGNLFIALTKTDFHSPDLQLPFRCCQLIFKRQVFMNMTITNKTDNEKTNRSDGGFGSTS